MKIHNTIKLILLALLISPAAQAADFTFNIPLRVENVPSMDSMAVECLVSRIRLSAPDRAGATNVIGRGSTTIRLTGGRYSGTVRVEVSATGLHPASSGQSYSCRLRGNGTARTGARYAASPGNFRSIYELATGHELDRLTLHVQGNF